MFIIYYKQNCPYSIATKELMKKLNMKYILYIVDNNNIKIIKSKLSQKYNHTTFPAIIYRNGNNKNTDIFIGGFDIFNKLIDLCKLLNTNKNNNFKELHNDINTNISYHNFLIIINFIIENATL